VPQEAIVAFHGIRLLFGLGMEGLRNHAFIRFPIVAHHGLEGVALDALPSLLARGGIAGTQYAMEEWLCMTIHSHPEPTGVFFAPISVCHSSISITATPTGRAKGVNRFPESFD